MVAPEALVSLRKLAAEVLGKALAGGATDAEVAIGEGDEFSALVRLGQVEMLKESGSRAIGLRVFAGLRTASSSSSDLSPEGIERLVSGAIDLARITSEDPFAGLPDAGALGRLDGDLELYHESVAALPAARRIELARRAETAALETDPRIQNSDGGSFDAVTGRKILVNSRGFDGEYRRSYCSIAAEPIALDGAGGMQRDSWYSISRSVEGLDTPESVGREAARRALRRLNARRVATTQVPVVFSPEAARSIVGHIFEAANGDSIYRGASFWSGCIGQKVASSNVTVVDDGTIPGGFGTAPFDGDGLPTERTVIVEKGILKNYLLNTYTARKLGMESTGNAARSLAGNPGIGAGNLFVEKGTVTPETLLGGIASGLYVTRLMGFGVNLVTGDYSRGASGLWIENGELAYAVEQITIAGNLKEMFLNLSEVADDLVFRGSVASPTLRIDGMTVAGE